MEMSMRERMIQMLGWLGDTNWARACAVGRDGSKGFFFFFSPPHTPFSVARPYQVLALVGMAPERYPSVSRTHVGVRYVTYAERFGVEPKHFEVRPRQQDATQRRHLGR